MKVIQIIVFSLIFSLSSLVFAAKSPLFGAPTPLQSYQSANAVQSVNHRAQLNQSSNNIAEKKASKPADQLTLKSHFNSEVANELESQMNTLNQANLLFQQSTNQKIENLSNQNAALQAKLQKLTTAMIMLNQQLSQIHSGDHSEKPAVKSSISFKSVLNYLVFGVVALLAVLLGVLLARQKKQPAA